MSAKLRRAEKVVAIALTAIAALLNLIAAVSAGPLWRDEANTVGLATLPSFSEVWRNLEYDSFPVLWIGFVRTLAGVAGELNDPAFRVAGFVIGLLLIGAMWMNARAFKLPYPLLSLALLALNPSVIRWGSSLRAYGFGMATAIITCIAIWRYVQNPRAINALAAAAAATVSVHTLFYNAPVVFAFCVAGFVVAATDRSWKSAAGVLLAGLVSAVSLLIYVPTIAGAASWNPLVRIPDYDFRWFVYKLNQAFHAGMWATIVFVFLVLLAAAAAAMELRRSPPRIQVADRKPLLYAAVALCVGSLSQYAFLKQLSYLTQPWYYLTLITLCVICVDVIIGKLVTVPALRAIRLAVVLLVAGFTLPSAISLARTRMTNVDTTAAMIARRERPDDHIVLEPWYIGISFDRYYRGSTTATMVPSIGDSRFHRYDRMRSFMVEADQASPARPAIDSVLNTLKRGGTVYLISETPVGDETPVRLKRPASLPEEGWKSSAYQTQWSKLFRNAVRRHAASIVTLDTESDAGISRYENLKLSVISGWRD